MHWRSTDTAKSRVTLAKTLLVQLLLYRFKFLLIQRRTLSLFWTMALVCPRRSSFPISEPLLAPVANNLWNKQPLLRIAPLAETVSSDNSVSDSTQRSWWLKRLPLNRFLLWETRSWRTVGVL